MRRQSVHDEFSVNCKVRWTFRVSIWDFKRGSPSFRGGVPKRRPGAAEPAKAGDAVVAPKQEGAQGFYKVWVSDAPIEAE